MRLLFLHPYFPGQFQHLARWLANQPGMRIWAVGDDAMAARTPLNPAITIHRYTLAEGAQARGGHPHGQAHEAALWRAQAAAGVLRAMRTAGEEPDVVWSHPGWGDALYVRDIFPRARLLGYCEFFYRPQGADIGFDPEFPLTEEELAGVRLRNSVNLLNLEACHWGLSPTGWQRTLHPAAYADRISVVHDGVHTDRVKPEEGAVATLPDGRRLTRQDEVLTFVNRNLEPYRGFHRFMRALPEIQRRRPRLQTVIVGGNGVSYGRPPPGGGSWKDALLAELGDRLDLSRIHFTGQVPLPTYLALLQVATAHVYLTYPFVLGWSMLDAMATACPIIASATPPVQEVMQDGVNGLLVDFHDHQALADRVVRVLADPAGHRFLGQAARQTVMERYDLRRVCLPRQLRILTDLANGGTPPLFLEEGGNA